MSNNTDGLPSLHTLWETCPHIHQGKLYTNKKKTKNIMPPGVYTREVDSCTN